MDELIPSVQRLGQMRGVPQFLFVEEVGPRSMIQTRAKVLDFKKQNKDCEEIDFILNSPGGLPDEAYRIIRTLRSNFLIVNIIVPFWAKSAATLLSLGGSRIVMDEFGEFGPLDAQTGKVRDDSPYFDWESALNDEHSVKILEYHFKDMYEQMFLHIYEHDSINIPKNELSKQLLDNLSRFYEPLLKQIDPYRLGEKRRTLDVGSHYATRILGQFSTLKDTSQVRSLVDFLVDGCPDHGYVIDIHLMKLFLPDTVVASKEFAGVDYAEALTEVSNWLIQRLRSGMRFVDFVELEEMEDANEPPLVDSSIKDTFEPLKVKPSTVNDKKNGKPTEK